MGAGWSDSGGHVRVNGKRTAAYDYGVAHDDGPLLLKGIVYALLLELVVLVGVAGITFLVFVIATRRL